MAQRSSATRNEIRRELDRRRKAISVAKGRVVKKSSAASPPPRLIPSAGTATMKLANAPKEGAAKKDSASLPYIPRVLIPTGAPGADRKVVYIDLGEAPKRLTMPRREALIPRFTMKEPKFTSPAPLIPHAPPAATKLSATTSHDHEATGLETKHIKKPSSAPIQQPPRLIPSARTATMKLAPKEGVAKKGSASLPYYPRVLIPTGAPGADRKIVYMDLGEAPKRLTMPRREALIPRFAMKEPKSTAPAALIPHVRATATKLSATTSHEHEATVAETKYIKKPSSILVKNGMTLS